MSFSGDFAVWTPVVGGRPDTAKSACGGHKLRARLDLATEDRSTCQEINQAGLFRNASGTTLISVAFLKRLTHQQEYPGPTVGAFTSALH